MNHAFDTCDVLNDVRVFDLCGVLHNSDFVRGEVMEIVSTEKMETCEMYLIDYGHRISVEKSQLHILKTEHASAEPFCLEFKLSTLNNDATDTMKEEVLHKFQKLVETDDVLIYFNGLVSGTFDQYDVILLADDRTENTYLLSESYAAFNYKMISFDKEVYGDWFRNVVDGTNQLDTVSRFGTKQLIEVAYIVSPMEIYIRKTKGMQQMDQIRQEINTHVRSVAWRTATDYSIGDACLVHQQNRFISNSKMMSWYRGRILSKNANEFEIFMVDYGYKVRAKKGDLMPSPNSCQKYEDSVSFCCLDIGGLVDMQSMIDTSTAQIKAVIQNYKKLAVSYSEHVAVVTIWGSNAPGLIEFDSDWDDLNAIFKNQFIINSMQKVISGHIEEIFIQTVDSDNNSGENIENQPTQASVLHRWDLPSKLNQTDVYGVVTFLHSNGTIFVQVGENNKIAAHLDFSNYIANNGILTKNHKFKKNQACIVYDTNRFRRGIITGIHHENACCQVMFADYGDKMMIK